MRAVSTLKLVDDQFGVKHPKSQVNYLLNPILQLP